MSISCELFAFTKHGRSRRVAVNGRNDYTNRYKTLTMPLVHIKNNPPSPAEELKMLLRRASLRATPGRLHLLRALKESRRPMSIKRINAVLARTRIDQATIYRTLETLAEKGIVRTIDFQHGHVHYELADADDHHHVVCRCCGRVGNFTGCDMESIARKAMSQCTQFVEIERHSLEFFGLCRACARSGGSDHTRKDRD